jgi:hypothetical protein
MAAMSRVASPAAFIGICLLGSGFARALSPAEKCEAAKVSISAKYDLCLLKAQVKVVKDPAAEISGDLAACDAKFTGKWDKAETKGAGACPTGGDATTTQAVIASTAHLLVDRFKPIPSAPSAPPPAMGSVREERHGRRAGRLASGVGP